MIINHKSSNNLSGFYIIYEGSVNLENEGTRGISHLIEHLMCKTFQDLRDQFQKYAIDWNATTSINHVSFYFTGLESGLSKVRNKIINRMSDFDVSKNDFELERKIVLEEYTDTFNKQPIKHINNIYRKYLNCYCPIGSKEDLQQLKFIDVLRYYEKNLIKPSKIINVSKQHKYRNDIIDFVDTRIEKEYTLTENNCKLESPKNKSEKTSIILLSKLEQENVPMLKFITKLIGSGLESPLYKEVREKNALCYTITCDTDRFNKQSLMKIQTLTQKNQEKKVIDIIKKILNNPERYITKERFDIIKNNLLNQQIKEEINRYLHVQDEISPKEFSIYHDLKKLTFDKTIKGYKEMINVDELLVSCDNQL